MTTIGHNNYQPILAKATKKPEDKKPVKEKTVDKNTEGATANNTQQATPEKPVKFEELRGYYNLTVMPISTAENEAVQEPVAQKLENDSIPARDSTNYPRWQPRIRRNGKESKNEYTYTDSSGREHRVRIVRGDTIDNIVPERRRSTTQE